MAVLSDAQREAGWTIAKLGDVCAFVAGSAFPQKEQGKVSGDYPFAKVKDLQSVAGLSWRNIDNWIEESQLKTLKSKIIPVKSIIFAKIGEGLKRERFAMSSIPMCIDNNLMAAVPSAAVNNIWLYYKFKTLNISSLVAGSALPYLRVQDLKDLDISLPPLEEQERIAGILGSLDDKIGANTRLVQTMDSYKSTRFQTHICSESEGETIKISDVATLIRENIAASDIDESMNYVALEHLPRHSLYSHEWTNSEGVMSNKSGFKVGDILFGKLRPYFHKVSIAAVDGITSTDILVLRPKPGFEVLAQSVLSSEDLIEYATQVSSGTRMPRASWKDIMNYEVTVKNIEILQKALSGFDTYSRALIHENKVLTETRDALTKRLIG